MLPPLSKENDMTKLEKIISIAIGAFMLIGGLNKFREPYITIFHEQIALSGLPFPTLSKWAGELGEISAGITLLALVILWENSPHFLRIQGFILQTC
jgi:hypothetical protein